MSFHRRRLPHCYLDGKALFLTWHLHGALPHGLYPPPGKASSGQAFVWMDRYLDTTRRGPVFLRMEQVAQLVRNGLETGEQLGHYRLHAWVVMANHVHTLLTPEIDPARLINSLKGTTAVLQTSSWGAQENHFGRLSVTTGGFARKTSSGALDPTLRKILSRLDS